MSFRTFDSDRSTRYTRKSLRLPRHNYRWTGTYFVTLHAKEPGPIFDIPELRAILAQEWEALPRRFPNVTLDEFVIMPDHVHFILRLEGNVEHAPALGSVIGAYKSLTTVAWLRHIQATNMECSARCWQRDYFEHVIRDAQELEQKRHYIRNNPLKLKTSNTDEQW